MNRRGGVRASPQAGFTLVELILVMIVIFTVAMVVAPRYTDFFPSFQVKKSAEHLLAWARKARAEAAITGTRHRLILDDKPRRYWLESEPRPLKDRGTFLPLGGSWGEELLPQGVSFESLDGVQMDAMSGGRRYVEFLPDGTCTEVTIILVNDRGDRETLRTEPTSSKIWIGTPGEEP